MKLDVRARLRVLAANRPLQVLTLTAAVLATAAAASPLEPAHMARRGVTAVEQAVTGTVAPPQPERLQLVWEGADVDGDGRPDFANPTGREPRGHDAYGEG